MEEYLKSKGGLWNPAFGNSLLQEIVEKYSIRALNFIRSAKGIVKPGVTFPDIKFSFIDNPKFNAFAAKAGNEYLIGVNIGVIPILFDLFNRIMAYPDLLTNIGVSEKEELDKPSLRQYYCDADLLVTVGDFDYQNLETTIPKDPTRHLYAMHMFEIAFDFLLSHELSHILNGHLGYMKENFSMNVLEELETSVTPEMISIKQTFEMDADTIGASKIISNLCKRHLGIQSFPPELTSFYTRKEDFLFMYVFAILTVFQIMDQSRVYGVFKMGETEHPFPRVRMNYILSNLMGYLEKYFPECLDEGLDKIMMGAYSETLKAYKKITGNPLETEKLKSEIQEAGRFGALYLEVWSKIKPELVKNAFVELHD